MTNVVQLRPQATRGRAEAITLVDALGLAIVAIGSRTRLIAHIAMKNFGYVGHPMPLDEPKIRYLGADHPVSEILEQCKVISGPLPPILRAMMIDLEADIDEEPELTARTFSEAIEALESLLEVDKDHILRLVDEGAAVL